MTQGYKLGEYSYLEVRIRKKKTIVFLEKLNKTRERKKCGQFRMAYWTMGLNVTEILSK